MGRSKNISNSEVQNTEPNEEPPKFIPQGTKKKKKNKQNPKLVEVRKQRRSGGIKAIEAKKAIENLSD